ncbi:sigma-54-dependent transcriptional regulator [Paenibacillus sp. Aloe-11]|uniref:sigma-54-dependent transcriptional regulator n=1 Tax=Paenibacillus sp. Aloe-11 TaxID=1050222 RepID=UPI00024EFBF2|nr:sigma-54-dependent transcriptional regulator [Paenibacillus sp. Aloe-11]EHS59329.1 transcriptional regulator [Paenibacillus sp. Aloe-11]
MKVLAIAPYEGLKELMIELAEKEQFDLEIEVGDLQAGLRLAKQAVADGVNVIISRGGTAEMIQKEVLVPVVEIEISGYDILRVLTLTKNYNEKTAIVGFPPIAHGAAAVCDVMDMDISTYVTDKDSVEGLLVRLKAEGYRMIIGDVVTVGKAEQLGLSGVLLTSGRESVLKAFQNAKKIHELMERLKDEFIVPHRIVKESSTGFVVFDENGKSVFANHSAPNPAVFEQMVQERNAFSVLKEKGFFQGTFRTDQQSWQVEGERLDQSDRMLYSFQIKSSSDVKFREIEGVTMILPFEKNMTYMNHMDMVKSEPMKKLIDESLKLSEMDEHFEIQGRVGTEKELMAEYIHFKSRRHQSPLLIVDALQISDQQWSCLFEENTIPPDGTLYIKNIDCTTSEQQKMLLQWLLDSAPKARLITSWAKTPEIDIQEDSVLYPLYELCGRLHIRIPDLKERGEDMIRLANLLIHECNEKFGKQIVGLRPEAEQLLRASMWPGNVDQLRRTMYQCVMQTNTAYVEAHDLETEIYAADTTYETGINLQGTLEEIEQDIIRKVFIEENENQTNTAKRLGINRTTLWRKLK